MMVGRQSLLRLATEPTESKVVETRVAIRIDKNLLLWVGLFQVRMTG